MSNLSGQYKAKIKSVETSPEVDESKNYIKVSFLMTHQYNPLMEDWDELETEQWANSIYNLSKTNKNPDAKMTPQEVSTRRWNKEYGFELFSKETLEDVNVALKDVEKILVLEADDSQYHKIKWINNLSKPKGAGRTLASLR